MRLDPASDAEGLSPRGLPAGAVRFEDSLEYVVEEEEEETQHADEMLGERRQLMDPMELETIRWLKALFSRMDKDGSEVVTKDEAIAFWGKGFAKISAEAMFDEVDMDGDGNITLEEFITFWQEVKKSGYTDREILEELGQLMEGGAWVDWKDNRKPADNSTSGKK